MQGIGLVDVIEGLSRLESQKLSVYPQQCVRSRHRKAQCTLCADACPEKVFKWDDSIKIDAHKCTGCGVCTSVCPTGALEAHNPSNEEILEQIKELPITSSTLTFVCPSVESEGGNAAIQVSCLGRVDESLILGAVALGIQNIVLNERECANCPKKSGHTIAQRAVSESIKILQTCGNSARVEFVTTSDFLNQPSQKKKPTLSTNKVHNSTQELNPTQTTQKGELPVRLPAKKQILKSSLQNIVDLNNLSELNSELWATIKINENCTGCQMCAFFCPTGALKKTMEEGKPAIVFNQTDCTNCHLCLDICYTNSIELSTQVDLCNVVNHKSEILWSNIQTSSPQEKMKRLRMFNLKP